MYNKFYSSIVVKTLICLSLFLGFALDGFSQVDTSSAICPPMKDHEGNTYNAVLVDGYCWTVAPLRTKYSRDGKAFPLSSYHSLFDENGKLIGNSCLGPGCVGGVSVDQEDLKAIHTPMCFEGYWNPDGIDIYKNYFYYNWSAATEACPMGWHLPSKDEWIHLIENSTFSSENLIKQGIWGQDADFYYAWSSTEYSKDTALIWYEMKSEYAQHLDIGGWITKIPKTFVGEVHCVRDEEVCPKMKDYDGNTYSTVAIGKQCWAAENLRTTHDRNGKLISLGKDTSSVRAYRYSPMRNEDYVGQYGYLYNYSAAANICPKGWHLPSNDDWSQLLMELGNSDRLYWTWYSRYYEGGKSIASKDGWSEVTTESRPWLVGDAVGDQPEKNDSTGFGARPAGAYSDGIYKFFGKGACFWSTIHNNDNDPYDFPYGMVWLDYQSGIGTDLSDSTMGLSVRCVRD